MSPPLVPSLNYLSPVEHNPSIEIVLPPAIFNVLHMLTCAKIEHSKPIFSATKPFLKTFK